MLLQRLRVARVGGRPGGGGGGGARMDNFSAPKSAHFLVLPRPKP